MIITLVIAVSISLVFSTLCSLLEAILFATRVIALEAAQAKGRGFTVRAAVLMSRYKARMDRPLSAILILNTLAHTIGAALAGWAAGELWGAGSLWIFSLAFTLAILIFTEIIPKTVGAVHWRILWPWSVWPLKALEILLTPAIWLTQGITSLIKRDKGAGPLISEEEILAAATLGAHDGEISRFEQKLIHNIIALEEKKAREIMTPRTVMETVDGSMTVARAVELAPGWGFTRLPVKGGDPEEVVGYVIKPEIIQAAGPDLARPLAELAKPIRFVVESADCLSLLESFLKRRQHLYLVIDEYGSIVGLITLEDVLESLLGHEIVDEMDVAVDLQEVARRRSRHLLNQTGEE
jgi:CBS domain containing-hemolysin-like protein